MLERRQQSPCVAHRVIFFDGLRVRSLPATLVGRQSARTRPEGRSTSEWACVLSAWGAELFDPAAVWIQPLCSAGWPRGNETTLVFLHRLSSSLEAWYPPVIRSIRPVAASRAGHPCCCSVAAPRLPSDQRESLCKKLCAQKMRDSSPDWGQIGCPRQDLD